MVVGESQFLVAMVCAVCVVIGGGGRAVWFWQRAAECVFRVICGASFYAPASLFGGWSSSGSTDAASCAFKEEMLLPF